MEKRKRDDVDLGIEGDQPILHVNGRRIEVEKIDFDSEKGCFVFHHPFGHVSRAFFGENPPSDWRDPHGSL